MPKKLFHAQAQAPELPRVRFMRNAPPGSKPAFVDVTRQVAKIEIERLDDGSGACALVRLNDKGELVWQTLHQSVEETRWQARHEYEIEEHDWIAY